MLTKTGIMAEDGLLPLVSLAACSDTDCVRLALFALGALAESDEVKARVVEIGGLTTVVAQAASDDMEIKRSCAYFLALVAEGMEVRWAVSVSNSMFGLGDQKELRVFLGASSLKAWRCGGRCLWATAWRDGEAGEAVFLAFLSPAWRVLFRRISTRLSPHHSLCFLF